jgi:hypothetical protein
LVLHASVVRDEAVLVDELVSGLMMHTEKKEGGQQL